MQSKNFYVRSIFWQKLGKNVEFLYIFSTTQKFSFFLHFSVSIFSFFRFSLLSSALVLSTRFLLSSWESLVTPPCLTENNIIWQNVFYYILFFIFAYFLYVHIFPCFVIYPRLYSTITCVSSFARITQLRIILLLTEL